MSARRRWRNAGVAAIFLAPSLVTLLAFWIGPMIGTVWVSLQDWNLIGVPSFVGLDNYAELAKDADFHAALLHTLGYLAGYLPLVLILGLAVALLLNAKLPAMTLYRAMFFLPVVSSWVAVSLLWKWLLNPAGGLVDQALGLIGIDGPGWWTDPTWAMPSVILASVWKDVGFVSVILLAGLQAIPKDLLEAADLDGASAWRRLRSITLPLLSPSLFFVTVISLINGFQVFDQVWVMTGGGPGGASSVVVEQIVRYAFSYGRVGYASAMSIVLFAIILVVTVAQLRLQRRWVQYD
ncbi:multiple sugar transport system permease protein [Hamadaea flava]|uniref:Carbohydrate ABC transporter permease n=1 Tax=Hamadaea flava TaxID=1742688 RepID=A0ABV8LYH4_9ACTN|nr:sugar ABC transporter permease [Hamadaea flava]MCP2324523.1 multiple sugar transport system permease protein [Hamadaea flava]